MYIGYDEKQEELRQTLRAYYAELLTPEVQRELGLGHGVGPTMRRIVRQMGEDGWLGIGWPKEYGGTGWDLMQRYIWTTECGLANAPGTAPMGLGMCGPMLIGHGTDEQRAFYLPRILSGED